MEKSNLKYAKKIFNIIGGADPQEMVNMADGMDPEDAAGAASTMDEGDMAAAAAAGAGGDGGAGGADAEDKPPDMTGEILLPWNQTKYRKFEKLFEEPCFSSQGICLVRKTKC